MMISWRLRLTSWSRVSVSIIIASESVFVGVGVDLRVEGRRPCPSQQTHGVTVGAAPHSVELSHL